MMQSMSTKNAFSMPVIHSAILLYFLLRIPRNFAPHQLRHLTVRIDA